MCVCEEMRTEGEVKLRGEMESVEVVWQPPVTINNYAVFYE